MSGHRTLATEFIAVALGRYLAAARPDADVWPGTAPTGMAQVLFEGLHPRLRVTNTLWRLAHENADPADVAAKNMRDSITGLGTPGIRSGHFEDA